MCVYDGQSALYSPKAIPWNKTKQEIVKSVLECDCLVFVLTVENIYTRGLLFILYGWMDRGLTDERVTRCSRVTQAYPVAAGVKNFSQHGGWAHNQHGDKDPNDDACVGRGGCRKEGESDRRSEAAGGGAVGSGTARGGAASWSAFQQ